MPIRVHEALTKGAPWGYADAVRHWYALGVRLPEEDTKLAAELVTRARVDHPPDPEMEQPIGIARLLLAYHPCRSLRRAYARSAGVDEMWGALGDWVLAFPDIEPELRRRVVARATDHGDPYRAFDAAMLWVIDLDGGDTAYRAAACAFVAADRRDIARGVSGKSYSGQFLRHCLESHGEYGAHHGRINALLVELGATTIQGAPMAPPAERPLHPRFDGAWRFIDRLAQAIAGSRALAGDRWGEDDIAHWAALLRARDPREIVALARALGALRGDAEAAMTEAERALGVELDPRDKLTMRWNDTRWNAERIEAAPALADILAATFNVAT